MATTTEHPPLVDIRKHPAVSKPFLYWHIFGLVVIGTGVLILTGMNFAPLFLNPAPSQEEHALILPGYTDGYRLWRAQAVQHGGRYKPFETAARETVREVTGRDRWNKLDAAAVVLAWMLEDDPQVLDPKSKWDNTPFILCQHKDLRRLIYTLKDNGELESAELTEEQVHGKYISPSELIVFRHKYQRLREINESRHKELFRSLEREAGAAFHRLRIYHDIRKPAETANARMSNEPLTHVSPFAFVALDKVRNAPWFSIDELRLIKQLPRNWYVLMKQRVKDFPQLYLSPEHQAALEDFQAKVQAGNGAEAIAELEPIMRERRQQLVKEYMDLLKQDKRTEAADLLASAILTWPLDAEVSGKKGSLNANQQALVEHLHQLADSDNPQLAQLIERYPRNPDRDILMHVLFNSKAEGDKRDNAVRDLLRARDERLLKDLQERLPQRYGYVPDNPKFRMLHLNYLELRFPSLYRDLAEWQEPPLAQVAQVLEKYDAAGQRYREGDDAAFTEASKALFATIQKVSEQITESAYPGEESVADRVADLATGNHIQQPGPQLLDLELLFNRVKPFLWAWVLMLGSLLFFILSLGLNNRLCYGLGFATYILSLAFQFFGFFTRIIISGRPPVTNMYETVIWVAFMSGIFALILEAVYRRKVIALAGALVSAIGLVLADQLPLALDPKINPLVPVLRSNFWLTIHVLTIVSSYAGGTLAWGLGNISLILIVFGSGVQRDTIKMLSNFIYRALQIAVLLLAAGTFLGGWWAAYSWGRFWGWDPKETGALVALVCYVIPLHMRYIGWIKDFGLAVAAILCYAAILISWYGVNFVFPAGLHAYGFGAGGQGWVYWACLLNIEWVLFASLIYRYKLTRPAVA